MSKVKRRHRVADCWDVLDIDAREALIYRDFKFPQGLGEPMRVDSFAPLLDEVEYRLYLWEGGYDFGHRKERIKYALISDDDGTITEIFTGSDFFCSPQHAIDSDACVLSLLGFLTLRDGDTDDEYFENYTPVQREFCESYACETLGCMVGQWAEEKGCN